MPSRTTNSSNSVSAIIGPTSPGLPSTRTLPTGPVSSSSGQQSSGEPNGNTCSGAYRYVYLDAGHIAQNLALGAVALGLGSCQIGALYDAEVNALLNVDGVEESAVYMTVVGVPR